MTSLRALLALPVRLLAIIAGSLGVALVAGSIVLTLMAEAVAE